MTRNVAEYLAILAVMLVFPPTARADLSTVRLGRAGIVDTWIGQDEDFPHGDSGELRTNSMGILDQRILIRFTDLTLLAGAKTIESARLGLYWYEGWIPDMSTGMAPPLTLEVHEIGSAWNGDVTYSTAPVFDGTVVSSTVAQGDTYKWVEWDVKSLVQKWVLDKAPNCGMAIYGTGSGDSESWSQSYVSSDLTENPEWTPRLDVAFVLTPVPASIVLGFLGLGVSGLKLRKFV